MKINLKKKVMNMDLFKTQGKHEITSSESCVEISQHSGPFGQSIELNTRWRSCHFSLLGIPT